MPISIPTIEQLTDDQWEIQDLPIDGRYMITGGPGSGKTSIAIRRTEYIKKDNPKASVHTFLFTNTLNDFFKDGIESLQIDSNIQVWAKWQRGFLIQHNAWNYNFNEPVPWDTLSDQILSLPLEKIYDHLIIDEAQDFSRSDLSVMNLIAENITVFADENQRLNDRGVADTGEIKEILDIDDEDTYHLKENHRNTKQIMEAAVSLAPNEIDVDLDTIVRPGQKPRVISNQSSDGEIEYISKVLRANKQKDIGIFHLEKNVIRVIFDKLQEYNDGEIEFELMRRQTFDFSNTNPKICTLNSAKGLEFDIVIMPQMNKDNYYVHTSNLKRIYVGMTRAREELHLCYFGGFPTSYLSQMDPDTTNNIEI